MSIAKKLMLARADFHEIPIKKSGRNTYSNYSYFEMSDFLIPGLKCMARHGLVPLVSFDNDFATMTIMDTESKETLVITSPMREVDLKGSNAMQAMGAVETYSMRYLWVAALQIVENDLIDSLPEEDRRPAKPKAKPATQKQKSYLEGLKDEQIPPRRLAWLQAGNNFATMTEAQARSIINECKELNKDG